ncbi:hypothetical protein Q1695_005950 [Nippostrongylus brasiliensis]|nr:hypothetical protein Q1695_005950 [Nippostrongylus brasiliensis]
MEGLGMNSVSFLEGGFVHEGLGSHSPSRRGSWAKEMSTARRTLLAPENLRSCSGATLALTFGEYIIEAITPVTCMSAEQRRASVLLLACGVLSATALLNMFSLRRVASRIQLVSMAAKIAALIMIIGIGFFYLIFKGETQHFAKDYIFEGSEWSASKIVLALYQGNWAYGGYTILNYGMEDVQIKDFKS